MSVPAHPISMTGWLGTRHLPYPFESPPDQLARRIVALKLPKKEFFEITFMADVIRSFIDPWEPIFDVCCGHGMLGMLLACDERVPRVTLLDRNFPPNLSRMQEVLSGHCHSLGVRVDLQEMRLESYLGFRPGALVAAHACGLATDAILAAAVRNRARFFVMTCCINHAVARRYGLPHVRGLEAEINSRRLQRYVGAGYQVSTLEISDRISPWNVILCGWPAEEAPHPRGGLRPTPLPALMPPESAPLLAGVSDRLEGRAGDH